MYIFRQNNFLITQSFKGVRKHILPSLSNKSNILICLSFDIISINSPPPNSSFLGPEEDGPGRKADARQWPVAWNLFLGEVGEGCVTFGALGGFPALTGGCAVDCLRWGAQLGARVSLGLGGWLSSGATAAVIICAPHRVQGLWPHGEAAGARMGKSVLRSRHRHESHAEMFAGVTSFVASSSFSTYAVKESRPQSMERNWARMCHMGYASRAEREKDSLNYTVSPKASAQTSNISFHSHFIG